MLEGLGLQATAGAGGVDIGGPPSRVGGQVTFPGSHLVNSPGDELAQAHEGPRRQRRGVQVVPRGREEGGALSLARFFFFCNHAFIVSRYKKPHAALAMERTKSINQKHITKESHGTS